MLSTVVLPQPEWPMMQTNSPRAIDSHSSSNTVVLPLPDAGKRLLTPSIEMNLSVMARHTLCRPRESGGTIFQRRWLGGPATHSASQTRVNALLLSRGAPRGDDSGAKGGAVMLLTPETSPAASRGR